MWNGIAAWAGAEPGGHVIQDEICQFQQGRDARIAQPVDDGAPLLLTRHQAAAMETGQVVRDVRLGETRGQDEFIDAARAVTQRFQEAETRGISQAPAELGFQIEVGQRRGNRYVGSSIAVDYISKH